MSPRSGIFTLLVMVGAFNLLTDIVIVVLPAPVVLGLHAKWKKKCESCRFFLYH
jgi:hypothetical protein